MAIARRDLISQNADYLFWQAFSWAKEGRAGYTRSFNQELQEGLAKTSWADPHCHSWYKNAKGHITRNWSSHTRDYAAGVTNVRWEDYTVREQRPVAAE
ncbi:MAG: hypothetical protein KBA31_06935 [Alphaproteobacteria bacterium]|nr:hypothetical protein [Alphaproteobacteria bacterium]